jgi:hypothetical protein
MDMDIVPVEEPSPPPLPPHPKVTAIEITDTTKIKNLDNLMLTSFMNGFEIECTWSSEIPPDLPFPKGGIFPPWERGAGGDFQHQVQTVLGPSTK